MPGSVSRAAASNSSRLSGSTDQMRERPGIRSAIADTPSFSAVMRSNARPATWLYEVITAVLPLRANSSEPRQLGSDTSRLGPLRGDGRDLGDPLLPHQARRRGAHAGGPRVLPHLGRGPDPRAARDPPRRGPPTVPAVAMDRRLHDRRGGRPV